MRRAPPCSSRKPLRCPVRSPTPFCCWVCRCLCSVAGNSSRSGSRFCCRLPAMRWAPGIGSFPRWRFSRWRISPISAGSCPGRGANPAPGRWLSSFRCSCSCSPSSSPGLRFRPNVSARRSMERSSRGCSVRCSNTPGLVPPDSAVRPCCSSFPMRRSPGTASSAPFRPVPGS